MKICFFADGKNVHARRLTSALAGRGHAVHFVSHRPVEIPGVSVERFQVPSPGVRHPFRWASRRAKYLKGFLRRFDVVVLFFLHDYGFTPDMFDEGCWVASPRGSDIVDPPGEIPPSDDLREARRQWLRSATMVGVAGPAFAKAVAEFAQLDEQAIERLSLGVDTSLFAPVGPVSESVETFRIGFLKGFREVYGAMDLVRAIPEILRRCPRAEFEFVGDGPQRTACMEWAERLSINEKVRWTPAVPHARVPEPLRHWAVSVLPSRCESFGLAALESSALEIPVVASDVGGLRDTVLHGSTGLRVPPGQPAALADAVIELLGDPVLRRKMGAAGRRFVQRQYEWSDVLNQWEVALERARDRAAVGV